MRKLKHKSNRAHLRALSVLSQMRRGKSLSQAARLEHTTVRTVRRQLGKQLRRNRSGKYVAKRSDTLRRDLYVFGPDGYVPVVVRSSRQAELASRHLIAAFEFFKHGNPDVLLPFIGQKVGGVELLTDPEKFREIADAGQLKLDSLYQSGGRGEQ